MNQKRFGLRTYQYDYEAHGDTPFKTPVVFTIYASTRERAVVKLNNWISKQKVVVYPNQRLKMYDFIKVRVAGRK